MTTYLLNAQETVRNLNAALSTRESSAPYNHTELCGTYALINEMISNLSSIKATIKTEEKNIRSDITTEMVNSGNSPKNMQIEVVPVVAHTIATSTCTAGHGTDTGASKRHHLASTDTANTTPAVLTSGTLKYADKAVIAILIEADRLIYMLKAGVHVAVDPMVLSTTVTII